MKPAGKEVYELIAGLSPQEKRFFRQESRQKRLNGGKYLELFELVLQMEPAGEQALRAHFDARYPGKRFEVLKAYLYERLLNSLHHFYEHSSQSVRIARMIHQAEVLAHRGRPREALRMLHKARKRALKYACIRQLPEIYRQMRLLQTVEPVLSQRRDMILDILREERHAIDQLANENAYATLLTHLFFMYLQEGVRKDPSTVARANAVMQDPLLQTPDQAISYLARMMYHNIHYFHAELCFDTEKAFHHARASVAHLETRPAVLTDQPRLYVAVVHNYLIYLKAQRNDAEFLATLERYARHGRKLLKHPFHAEMGILVEFRVHTLRMNFFRETGAYDRGLDYATEIEAFLQAQAGHEDQLRIVNLWLLLASNYLAVGQYRTALKALQLPLQARRGIRREDQILSIDLMHILVHFELGNIDLLDALIRSFYRKLRKKEELNPSHEAVMKVIRHDLPRAADPRQWRHWVTAARDALAAAGWDFARLYVIWAFDLKSYLDAKLEGKTLAQYVRDKNS